MSPVCVFFLFIAEIIYFYLAKKYQITDLPNHRSSHTNVTIRGGGIIIYISCLFYYFTNKFNYPYFIISLSLISLISFWDDIKNISRRLRLATHIICLGILLFETQLISTPLTCAIYILAGLLILNGFNFMDGINGITVAYSIIVLMSFLYVEKYLFHYVDINLLLNVLMSLIVFGFFNFRIKAKTFAGDVGSVSIALFFIFLQVMIYQLTNNFIFLFFFSIYSIDVIYTLVYRLLKKQNIFQGHRLHLFQLLKNEMNINPLIVASSYAFIQLIFNIGILWVWNKLLIYQVVYIIGGYILILSGYILLRKYISSKLTV